MVRRDVIEGVLASLECKPIMRGELQAKLQDMLGTKNEFEEGDTDGKFDCCVYFTNGHETSTANMCDIRIDYLPTLNEGEIYVTGTEILDYQY